MISLKIFKRTKIRQIPIFIIPSVELCEKKSGIADSISKENKRKIKKEDSAAEKLNKLLVSMKTSENLTSMKSEDMPRSGKTQSKKIELSNKIAPNGAKEELVDIIHAAKDVANLIAGNKKTTESELLAKLLTHANSGNSLASCDKSEGKLKNIIHGMKVDHTRKSRTSAEYLRQTISDQKQKQRFPTQKQYKIYLNKDEELVTKGSQTMRGSTNLLSEEPLNIFMNNESCREVHNCLKLWEQSEMKEKKLAVSNPPANYIEKMIYWNEEGKVWIFPINNEQGLEKEEEVDFTEHIFLEQHLESWCPKRGPIRHFMELVCVGLSKNSYITSEEKKQHILWYKNYFEQKKVTLKEIIVQNASTKSIGL